jgi:hypothetical protein
VAGCHVVQQEAAAAAAENEKLQMIHYQTAPYSAAAMQKEVKA